METHDGENSVPLSLVSETLVNHPVLLDGFRPRRLGQLGQSVPLAQKGRPNRQSEIEKGEKPGIERVRKKSKTNKKRSSSSLSSLPTSPPSPKPDEKEDSEGRKGL